MWVIEGGNVEHRTESVADRQVTQSTAAGAQREVDSELELQSMFGGRRPTPEMSEVLMAMQMLDHKPLDTLDAKQARRQPTPADAVRLLLRERGEATDPEDVGDVQDGVIDGPVGEIPVRIYTPATMDVADRAMPIIVYFHGGGWVIADLDTYDASARALCNVAHAVVVSCHYRQAPEHRFPAAHQDAYAAYRHVALHARDYGGDPSRIAVVGESAGGNLAAVCCLNAKLEGIREPVHQVLIYPIADSDMETESYAEMVSAMPLNSRDMRWFFQQYLERPAQGETPAISLRRAASLHGMPPVTVVCAELDPLRSEGEGLADRFARSGVPVAQRTYAGVTHEFFGMAPVLTPARDAQRFVGERLREAFFPA
jgi:acetyl esterase/lipase